jgi:5-methylcytosine-specific restriction endonuclease McrA
MSYDPNWRNTYYARADWRAKSKRQILNYPLCAMCGRPAEVADHIRSHHGDLNEFLRGALQSLCRSCNSKKRADDARGYSTATGVTGEPIDKRHPYWSQDRAGTPDTKPEPKPKKKWYC